MSNDITQSVPETGTIDTVKSENMQTPPSIDDSNVPAKKVKKGASKPGTKKEKPKEMMPAPQPKTEEEPEQAPPIGLKVFVLLDQKTGDPLAKYTNKQPRQAALKAAAEGHVDILMREVGSANNRRAALLHRFTGERKQVPWADYGLPYNTYALKKVEELSGKPVPPELNVKGGAQALRDAGFKDFLFWKPNVKKVARINVPKFQGKTTIETVQEFVKGLGA